MNNYVIVSKVFKSFRIDKLVVTCCWQLWGLRFVGEHRSQGSRMSGVRAGRVVKPSLTRGHRAKKGPGEGSAHAAASLAALHGGVHIRLEIFLSVVALLFKH